MMNYFFSSFASVFYSYLTFASKSGGNVVPSASTDRQWPKTSSKCNFLGILSKREFLKIDISECFSL